MMVMGDLHYDCDVCPGTLLVVSKMQVQRSDTRDDISFSAGQEPVGRKNGATCEIYH